MIRLFTFLLVFLVLALYFVRVMRSEQRARQPSLTPSPRPKQVRKTRLERGEFWSQVYDTDSAQEARKIQKKFLDMGIECLVYEQGKKDVYGEMLKHYGLSVSHEHLEKAQTILSKIAL